MKKLILCLLVGFILLTNIGVVSADNQNFELDYVSKELADAKMRNILFNDVNLQRAQIDYITTAKVVTDFIDEISVLGEAKLDSSVSLLQELTVLKGIDEKLYYNIDLYKGDDYVGYAILGQHEGKTIVVD